MSSKQYETLPENIEGIPPEFRRTEKEAYLLGYLSQRKKIEDSYKDIRESKKKIERYLKKFPDLKSFVRGPSPKKEEKKKEEETQEEKEKREAAREKKRLKQKARRDRKKTEKGRKGGEDEERMRED